MQCRRQKAHGSPACQPHPLHSIALPADYRNSGNTGAVLMIAPSLEFEFVCFPPAARPDGTLAAQTVEDKFSSPQPAAPLPDNAGVSLPVGPLAASPFAADAEVPLRGAAPAAGAEATPAAQTMQQVRRSAAVWPGTVWATHGLSNACRAVYRTVLPAALSWHHSGSPSRKRRRSGRSSATKPWPSWLARAAWAWNSWSR